MAALIRNLNTKWKSFIPGISTNSYVNTRKESITVQPTSRIACACRILSLGEVFGLLLLHRNFSVFTRVTFAFSKFRYELK